MSPFRVTNVSRKQRWNNFLTLETNSAHKHNQLGFKITKTISAWKIYFRSPRGESSNSTRVFRIVLKAERILMLAVFFSWSCCNEMERARKGNDNDNEATPLSGGVTATNWPKGQNGCTVLHLRLHLFELAKAILLIESRTLQWGV